MKNLKATLLLSFSMLLAANFTFAGGYEIGDMADDFKLKNIDGNMVSMADYTNSNGLIVVFTCNHCPYAKLYEQRIIDLHNKFSGQGYSVLAINPNDPDKVPDDSFDNMVKRAKKKSYPFPYLFDETQEVAKAFGATRTPHVYLLKKIQDKYRVSYIGAIDDNPQNESEVEQTYVEDAIASLKKGDNVAVSTTKAIGCTIKWK